MIRYLCAILKRIPTFCGGQTYTSYCHTLIDITDFRILSDISN